MVVSLAWVLGHLWQEAPHLLLSFLLWHEVPTQGDSAERRGLEGDLWS